MALSAQVRYADQGVGDIDAAINPEIVDSEVLYAGALVGLSTRAHATSAEQGRAKGFVQEAGQFPVGFYQGAEATAGSRTGDTSATPTVRADVGIPKRAALLPVTGLSGDRTDVSRLVYASDDGTFTLTHSDPNTPIGIVVTEHDSSNAWVLLFSLEGRTVLDLAGAGQHLWHLGVVSGNFSSGGNAITGISAPHHGRIVEVWLNVISTLTPSGGDLDFNLEIGGTNVTGGVMAWLETDSPGDKKAGTAITAENVVHAGDLIDVEVAVNTAGTGGFAQIYALVQTDVGL